MVVGGDVEAATDITPGDPLKMSGCNACSSDCSEDVHKVADKFV